MNNDVLCGPLEIRNMTPHFCEIGILAFVPERWGGVWGTRHYVSTTLAKYFNIVWLNPPSEWREAVWYLIGGKRPPSAPFETKGFKIYEPGFWLPRIYRPRLASKITAWSRIRMASRLLEKKGCTKTIFYIWRPVFEYALDFAKPDVSIYHIDDEYSFSDAEKPLDEGEARLIKRVDQVFIHSAALVDKKGHLNPNTTFVPNGVDYEAYNRREKEPEDLVGISHPRIGYVGVIKKQLDFRLLTEVVGRCPEWSFVLVGPQGYLGEWGDSFKELLHHRNVHWLGGKPVGELPAYTQHLDVCLMPYLVNDYTKYIFPLKLHEYLASGRPVVGSPIRTLLDFAEVVSLAATPEEWSSAIEQALIPAACSPEKVAERRRVARRYDWDVLVRTIAGTICERLGGSYPERFQTLKDSIGADEPAGSLEYGKLNHLWSASWLKPL